MRLVKSKMADIFCCNFELRCFALLCFAFCSPALRRPTATLSGRSSPFGCGSSKAVGLGDMVLWCWRLPDGRDDFG